ncbi:MAG: Gfo/Idh/MocA family oxidoreductase [Verrucomicrobia bacterium]|nr:Gfo/Idh/MocA family oxidoreductase [Verrucomicrobiota bacterium]
MNPHPSLTRRRFLQHAATVAGAAVGARFLSMPALLSAAAPNTKLGVAVIGVGGMGGYSFDAGMRERLVAICDVDDNILAGALKKFGEKKKGEPAPKVYVDYRRMLDECHKDIDAVLIATPDHHHAPAAIRAIHLGKAAFCQKPLAHNIHECRALATAAREKNVPTQMGNQGHCSETIRRACEYLWAGAIGNVTETHSILGRNFGGTGGRPASKPVPAHLHWDEWLGPAPFREYHDGLHTFSWRSWRHFGTGTIGDMACHNLDILFWALRIADAKTFTVECLNTNGGSEEMWAQNNIVRYDVPARGNLGPVKVHVYDHGDLKSELMKETEKKYDIKFGECTLFVGDKGLYRTTGTSGSGEFLPKERKNEVPSPWRTLPRAHGGPIEDLFHAIKNGGTPCSNFPDSAGPLTAFALAGHLAQAAGVGKKVEWDVEKMQCTNLPEINRLVRRSYRVGWEV